jgi:hypothetical protein
MQTICAIVLCGVLAAAAQPGINGGVANPDANGASTAVYALSFHPEAGALLPAGAMYVCRARIMPGASASQPAMGSGNNAGCALEVPFVWQANRPQPVATLSYEVYLVGADGRVLRSVARQGVALPDPEPGVSRVTLIF